MQKGSRVNTIVLRYTVITVVGIYSTRERERERERESRNAMLTRLETLIFSSVRRHDVPPEVVILYQIGRGHHAPSVSPFPLKLETFLRMTKTPYVVSMGVIYIHKQAETAKSIPDEKNYIYMYFASPDPYVWKCNELRQRIYFIHLPFS